MKLHTSLSAVAALVLVSINEALPAPPEAPADYRLLYEQNFDDADALQDFVMTDPRAWRIAADGDNRSLENFQQSDYRPPHRSPLNIALIANKVFGDFILEVDLLSTKEPYGHQDMCLFFGFQNPANFYYNHIAVSADPHAHNIFLVKDAPRTAIAKKTTDGITWGVNRWHKVKLQRDTASGTIKVWFNDMSEPLMLAEDKNFSSGYIGFGTFDDTGKIDNIRIWGPDVEEKKTDFFTPPGR